MTIMTFSVVSAVAAGQGSLYNNSSVFDSDTKAIQINNCALGCISNNSDDFVGLLQECH